MFNDYMILMMDKIVKSGLSDDDINDFESSKNVIDDVIQKYRANETMQQCIEKEFEWLKSCLSKDDSCKAEKNTVYWAGLFLNQSLEMKLRIDPKANPRIVILDSI